MNFPNMTDVATLLNDCRFLCLGLCAPLVKVEDSQPLTSVSCTALKWSMVHVVVLGDQLMHQIAMGEPDTHNCVSGMYRFFSVPALILQWLSTSAEYEMMPCISARLMGLDSPSAICLSNSLNLQMEQTCILSLYLSVPLYQCKIFYQPLLCTTSETWNTYRLFCISVGLRV